MSGTLVHDALIYDSDEAYLASIVPFLQEGLSRGDGAVVATHDRNRDLLAAELGSHADAIAFVPATDVYRSIHGAIRTYDDVLDRFRRAGTTAVRAIGEIPYGVATDADAWLRYEPIAHSVFADAPLHVICPYDARTLPASLIEHAERTHPHLTHGAERRPSLAFTDPEQLVRAMRSADATTLLGTPELLVRSDLPDLRTARHVIGDAIEQHLPSDRREEALLAISEAMANGVRHGTGATTAALWTRADELVCVIRNDGPAISDPFAGYRPPARPASNGMGLWITRQLADRLEIDHDERGPVITLAFSTRS